MQNIDKEAFIDVPCTKCIECLGRKRNAWTFRLTQEKKLCKTSHFITLTYNDQNLIYTNKEPTLYKPDLQQFIKNLRDYQRRKTKSKWRIKYYATGEYGTELSRPHYHAVMFNIHPETIKNINQIWKKGHTHVGNVTPASIRYLTKYLINKVNKKPDKESEFNLISQGIGKSYVKLTKKYHKSNKSTVVTMDNGAKTPMPRYIKDKIWPKYDKQAKQELVQQAVEMSDQRESELIKKYGSRLYHKLKVQHTEHKIKRLGTHLNKNNKL